MLRSIKIKVESQKEPTDLALEDSQDLTKQISDTFRDSNIREKMNDKLTDRYMVKQMGQNPFLSGSTYLDDLQIQEQFLRPKSSHSENNEAK
jgi:hypothetical protein